MLSFIHIDNVSNYSPRDGFDAKDFHERCDNKGPTLTIIQATSECVFGGYSHLSWDCSGEKKIHPYTFIFTLINPQDIPPTRYFNGEEGIEINCVERYGPTFGKTNSAIYVSKNSNEDKKNYTLFPHDDVGTKRISKFRDVKLYTARDIVVFSVIDKLNSK